ncbi:hypothetical protein Tco_1376467 [Tanacetum coccineum]
MKKDEREWKGKVLTIGNGGCEELVVDEGVFLNVGFWLILDWVLVFLRWLLMLMNKGKNAKMVEHRDDSTTLEG